MSPFAPPPPPACHKIEINRQVTDMLKGESRCETKKNVSFRDVFFYKKNIAMTVYLKGIFKVTFKQYAKKKILEKDRKWRCDLK